MIFRFKAVKLINFLHEPLTAAVPPAAYKLKPGNLLWQTTFILTKKTETQFFSVKGKNWPRLDYTVERQPLFTYVNANNVSTGYCEPKIAATEKPDSYATLSQPLINH